MKPADRRTRGENQFIRFQSDDVLSDPNEKNMSAKQLEIWDLWYPFAAATGMPFARSRIDHTDTIYVHSAPEALTVEVRSDDGNLLARGQDLPRTTRECPNDKADTPGQQHHPRRRVAR